MATFNFRREIFEDSTNTTEALKNCTIECDRSQNPTGSCISFCAVHCPAFCHTDSSLAPSPPPPFTRSYILTTPPKHHHSPLSLPLKISVVVLVVTFSLFLLYTLYKFYTVWYRSRRRRSPPPPGNEETHDEFLDHNVLDHPIWYIRTIGLQPSVISAITVVKYSDGDGLIDGKYCSVCLSEFQEDEELRLLPKCNHAFHISCIDTWLRSHTNCPLCRAGIVKNTANSPSLDLNLDDPGHMEETQLAISIPEEIDRGEREREEDYRSSELRIGVVDEEDSNDKPEMIGGSGTSDFLIMRSLSSQAAGFEYLKMNFVKTLAESPNLHSIPSIYAYSTNPNESPASNPQDSIPIIDFSLLTSTDLDLRSQVTQELGKACKDWGFFQVINHGVPVTLMNMVIEKSNEFFNLSDEEKKDFEEKDVLDPIRYGTSFNSKKDKVFCWRDFLKVFMHPEFHSLNKPFGFSEVLLEYSKRTREVTVGLLNGISLSLGLDPLSIQKDLKLESGLQIFIANLYPPCPQPELAMGIPPHSDHGLLTLLIHNGVTGLQIRHEDKWVNVNDTLPGSFLVNTADQLEILSNGKYKSVEHRAMVNNKMTRISVAVANGPSLDAVVGPAFGLGSVAYVPMMYKEYLELQQGNKLDGKSCLDRVRV